MKVVRFHAFGTPEEVATAEDVDDAAAPGDGEVRVTVEAFPINPVDLLTIKGEYAQKPELPAVPGSEGVARVTDVGPGVDGLEAGDRVLLMGRANWAQAKTVPAGELLKVPSGLDPLQAAMLKINPATAWLMLTRYVAPEPGDWMIQNAANSGVGLNVIRLAHRAGWKSIAVVRRPEAAEECDAAGADAVVTAGPTAGSEARAKAEGAAIRLGLDAVCGEATQQLADALDDGGTIVNYGLLSGQPCQVRPFDVTFRSITLTGFWLVKFLGAMDAAEKRALYDELSSLVLDGTLHVPVEATYGIDDIQGALAHAAKGGRAGKILVTPNGPVG